ncbi:MAG: cobalamin-dependent protein [Firmicutes bacterium]|nr:cobalamin-dependent protein [Bacillota bacterium]
MAIYDEIKAAMGELDEDEVIRLVNEALVNADANQALVACQEGLNIVGERFEAQEYFVSDLIFAGDIMSEAVGILKPALSAGGDSSSAGKVVLCTVKGDLHDIGKNIVKSLLEASNFEVFDLGIDIAPEDVVAAAKKEGANIIALSGVLTLAIDAMKETVDAFKAAGMRDQVKIIIGGAPVTAEVSEMVGSDTWSLVPQKGVKICLEWAKQ